MESVDGQRHELVDERRTDVVKLLVRIDVYWLSEVARSKELRRVRWMRGNLLVERDLPFPACKKRRTTVGQSARVVEDL